MNQSEHRPNPQELKDIGAIDFLSERKLLYLTIMGTVKKLSLHPAIKAVAH